MLNDKVLEYLTEPQREQLQRAYEITEAETSALKGVVKRLSDRKENAPLFRMLERVAVQSTYSESHPEMAFFEGQRSLARYLLSMRYDDE